MKEYQYHRVRGYWKTISFRDGTKKKIYIRSHLMRTIKNKKSPRVRYRLNFDLIYGKKKEKANVK